MATFIPSIGTLAAAATGACMSAMVRGADRAKYGDQLIKRVGAQLAQKFGRGFEAKNLRRMMQFALAFPDAENVASLMRHLSWSSSCTRHCWKRASGWRGGGGCWRGVRMRDVYAQAHAVGRKQIPGGQYQAVMIDEGHDFAPEWLKLVTQMVDPTTNSLLVLYDDAQRIYERGQSRDKSKQFSFKSVGIQAQGRTTILKINCRNNRQILHTASLVANVPSQRKLSHRVRERSSDCNPTLAHVSPHPVVTLLGAGHIPVGTQQATRVAA